MGVCMSGCLKVTCHINNYFRVKEQQDLAAFDQQSSSLIKLNNGTVLYLREVNKFLALVCILREDNFNHQGNSVYVTKLFKVKRFVLQV